MKKPAAPPTSRTAVLYARVSTAEQAREGFSIPAQVQLLEEYARARGVEIAARFTDVESAGKAGREQFGAMLSYLAAHPATRVVLVEKTDRLYRNPKDWVTVEDLELEVHLVKEGSVISKDSRSSEKFMHGIRVLMARNFLDNLREEVIKGMNQKAAEGLWPTKAPVGYLNVPGDRGKSTIAPDPAKAPLVRQLFELYATGNFSLDELRRTLGRDGLCERSGRIYPRATVHRLLRNPIFKGEVDWKGKTVRGAHVPLVTPELWHRVQDVLAGRRARKTRRSVHDFAFARLVVCGHCGCALTGDLKKGRYVYYRCTGNKGRCPEPYAREAQLSEAFARAIDALSFDREVLDWIATGLRASHAEAQRCHAEAIARHRAEIDRLQKRLDAAYLDRLDGRIALEQYDRMAGEWRAAQDAAQREIAAHTSATRTYVDEGIALLELARRAGVLFRMQPPQEQRRLLAFLCSNSRWANGTLVVDYRQPFDILANAVARAANQNSERSPNLDEHPVWRSFGDTFRTIVLAPDAAVRLTLEAVTALVAA